MECVHADSKHPELSAGTSCCTHEVPAMHELQRHAIADYASRHVSFLQVRMPQLSEIQIETYFESSM